AGLYVGIQEQVARHFDFRTPPQSDIALPQEVVEDHENFREAFMEAVFRGAAGEDWSEGHSLADNPGARAFQERFLVYAERHLERLREVLRDSADAEQRAIAATVIGYAPDKRAVLDALQSATRDFDWSVRNNAMRSLGIIAILAGRQPELGIEISPTGFIEMLNSLLWTDRNKALSVLWSLTEGRDPGVLRQLREQALPSLVEVARFKNAGHALPAYLILGRMAGLSDKEIEEAWSSGERESVITQVLKSR
ncbi:HEAT repeat domain-containing protein, partial [Acidobacteria bacterium AH-259-D05]|nr:HEAT repeat domain-containing protein [Acidobacteria bacterium AH-259-D05]